MWPQVWGSRIKTQGLSFHGREHRPLSLWSSEEGGTGTRKTGLAGAICYGTGGHRGATQGQEYDQTGGSKPGCPSQHSGLSSFRRFDNGICGTLSPSGGNVTPACSPLLQDQPCHFLLHLTGSSLSSSSGRSLQSPQYCDTWCQPQLLTVVLLSDTAPGTLSSMKSGALSLLPTPVVPAPDT